MTQAPRTGQSAPTGAGWPPAGGRPSTAPGTSNGSEHWGNGAPPSPDNPASATPWGSTSTSASGTIPAPPPPPQGSGYGRATSDSPTGTLPPLVQGTRPPAEPAPKRNSSSHGESRGNRGSRQRGPRRARLQLRHIDPWTVLKFSCVLSIALFFVWLIVVGVLFGILDASGVIDKINNAVTSINANGGQPPIRATIVFGGAAIIGVVNIVLFIALSTVGAVVYNLCADLVGGIEVTLSER
jgi:hypothetical protein